MMPQVTEFPPLPEGDETAGVNALISVCRELPGAGEPLRDFRRRLRSYRLWDRERGPELLRFLGLGAEGQVRPSELMRQVAAAKPEKARDILAERLWEANPILFKEVIERVAERVHPPKELFGVIDSHAYRGRRVPWTSFESWLRLARGLGVLRPLGIALGLGERGEKFLPAARDFDVDEYLEEEAEIGEAEGPEAALPEVEPEAGEASPVAAQGPSPAALAPARNGDPGGGAYASPLGREHPVPISSFAPKARDPSEAARGDRVAAVVSAQLFAGEVLEETRRRIAGWWGEQEAGGGSPSLDDFGLDGNAWTENAEETLYRISVAAALVFRLGAGQGVVSAFRGLEEDGVLGDLYYGTAPETLSERVNPKALMLASLVARRCAEAPELAATLEKQRSAAEAFAALDRALGRGLFKVELFWIMRQLERLGALRGEGLADYTSVPHREVRDALFRLGFLTTPYAHDAWDLVPAAAAARRAVGEGAPADEVLAAFVRAAGCAYDCPKRRACEYACRERLE